uniref:Sugar ABC transporter permease n=1 Tax=Litorilinea aerophila TaxID=1204385 RepID=A0A540VM72_9CHLR
MQALAHKSIPATGERGVAASPITQKRRRSWLRSDMFIAVLVLTPSIIAVALFIYGFIGWTFYMSTVKWNSQVPDFTFVGLANWERLFSDRRFHIDLRNLVYYAAGFMTQCIVFGFIIAALLDQKIKGEAIYRTIIIFPFAVSGIVTGVAWRWLMQPSTGINLLFAKIGLENFQPTWNSHPQYGMWAVSIAAAWQFTGYVMALYLAGLRGIPNELREAAAIDGAGTFATYRHVIIPLLMPVTFTAIVLTGMNSIRVFDLVSAMSGSGPAFATDTLAFYMFQSTFGAYRYSLGAAIGSFMIFLSAFLIVPYLMSMRGEVER